MSERIEVRGGLVLMDDEKARGFLFGYDKLLRAKPLTTANIKMHRRAEKHRKIVRGASSTYLAVALYLA